tara:strand:- start:67 stop:438 length:372 start_codon:yes stop_codon:yes gene_type:complete
MTENMDKTEEPQTEEPKTEEPHNYCNVVGSVNWFNRRKGYGFISIVTPDHELKDQDIFCHYSNINTENYKILYPGEYVSFNISKNKEGKFICDNITGVFGNNLLTDNTKYFYRVSENKKDSNQ